MQIYSNPERENETYALPDVEVFFVSTNEFRYADKDTWMFELLRENCSRNPDAIELSQQAASLKGYYYWFCFPGCLPDSDPTGPFGTEQEVIDAAREG